MPSNLTEIPRVSEKYEMQSFAFSEEIRNNLKTMELLQNNISGQSCLNFNPGFFGGISTAAQTPVSVKDPF